jgi:hypothetical protein
MKPLHRTLIIGLSSLLAASALAATSPGAITIKFTKPLAADSSVTFQLNNSPVIYFGKTQGSKSEISFNGPNNFIPPSSWTGLCGGSNTLCNYYKVNQTGATNIAQITFKQTNNETATATVKFILTQTKNKTVAAKVLSPMTQTCNMFNSTCQ